MVRNVYYFVFMLLLGAFAAFPTFAQADDSPLPGFDRQRDDDLMSKSLRESRTKMRIDKEKKDHDEMLDRAEEVRRLSERLERSFAQNGKLSSEDITALDTVERNTKKIRSELGGSDDDDKLEEVLRNGSGTPFVDAVNALSNSASTLANEVKKTSRFSISASAIESSNAVLAVARFLRVKN
jgi:hypothetical protein